METYLRTSGGWRSLRDGHVETGPAALLDRPAESSSTAYYENLSGSTLPAKADTAGSTKAVSFDEGTFEFSDFATGANNYGWYSGVIQGIYGRGVDHTIFQMEEMSSTQGSRVPASNPPTSNGQVNPLYLMRLGDQFNPQPTIKGFTLQATDQGHLYHGLRPYQCTGGLVEDVLIRGLVGDLSREPGETMSISTYTCSNMTFNRVEVDGRDASGDAVASSGFGINRGSGNTFTDCYSHDMAVAHGWAMWESGTATFNQCHVANVGLVGFNFENQTGTVTMNDCISTGCPQYHIAIASNHDSAEYVINDPIFDGPKLKVRVSGYGGEARTQDPDQVNLYVDGTLRNDLMDLTVQS